MKRLLTIIKIMFLMLCLYIIQFLVFPNLFPNYFRVSNEAIALYWIAFALTTFVGAIKFSVHIIDWLPGNALYLLCLKLHSASGAYNVQLDGHQRMKWLLFTIVIYAVELILFELLIIGCARLVCKTIGQ